MTLYVDGIAPKGKHKKNPYIYRRKVRTRTWLFKTILTRTRIRTTILILLFFRTRTRTNFQKESVSVTFTHQKTNVFPYTSILRSRT